MCGRYGSNTALLVEEFDAVVFDYRVAEDIACYRIQVLAGLHCDLEILALADIFNAPVTESIEGGANGLTLGIEDRGFEGYVYAGFHLD
jgi:hypothetical protein